MQTEQPANITALITGGTRRVGLATARAFASARATLILTTRDPRSDEAIRAKQELEGLGARIELERLDPGVPDSIASLAARVAGRHASLDALVHNASNYDPSPLETLTFSQMSDAMNVNAFGPALLTQSLRRQLEASGHPGGAGVVAMVDMHILGRPRKDLLAYSMSKAALAEAVRSLAREFAPKVRVNAVAPGVVAWPEQGSESGASFQREYLSRVPLERAGTPADAAETVRWLALDARYTTGEIVRVDGGRWLA
ncbi:MAG: SDR family oxidoreductase [Phycisphaerae bacterium]|nr:SDR family oxidoreductase [Phycisphaerae bacterium]